MRREELAVIGRWMASLKEIRCCSGGRVSDVTCEWWGGGWLVCTYGLPDTEELRDLVLMEEKKLVAMIGMRVGVEFRYLPGVPNEDGK